MLTAIIVAAGSSQRMGFDKIFAPLASKPVVAHAIDAFEQTASVDEIVLVGRSDRLDELQDIVKDQGFAQSAEGDSWRRAAPGLSSGRSG